MLEEYYDDEDSNKEQVVDDVHDDDDVRDEDDNDDAHPKQHEDEGVDDGLQEAEPGTDTRNCKAEKRKLSPGSFQPI